MSDEAIRFTDYRFRVVGYWNLDVRVRATDLEHAKAKLRAEADVIGTTPQELNRRYHDHKYHGESWCDNGLADFLAALAGLTLDQPFYSADHGATLFVRAGEYPVEVLMEYLFTIRYEPDVAYEASILATSLEAALDQIFEGKVSFQLTATSVEEFGDGIRELGPADLTDELALLAELTRTRARSDTAEYSVDYQLVHTVPAEG